MDQDLIKAIRYLWNEEMRKDQDTEAMNCWNAEVEDNQNNGDETNKEGEKDRDGEDGDKDSEGGKDRDRDGKGDANGEVEAMNHWNKERVNNEHHFKAIINERGTHISTKLSLTYHTHCSCSVCFSPFSPPICVILFRVLDQALKIIIRMLSDKSKLHQWLL